MRASNKCKQTEAAYMRPGPLTINPFLNFLRDCRKKGLGWSAVETVKRGAQRWKKLSEKAKRKYRAQARKVAKLKDKCMNPGPVTKNGYLNFLREYRQTHCGLTAVEIVCKGAKAWNRLTKSAKNRYKAMGFRRHSALRSTTRCRQRKRSALRCPTQRSRSASQAKTHNNNKHSCSVKTKGKFMKPGPVTRNGYLNFLREYRQKHCGLSAVEIVCQGAKAWHQLPEKEKNRYTAMVSERHRSALRCPTQRSRSASQAKTHNNNKHSCSVKTKGKFMKPGPVTRNGYLNFLREYRQKHCGLSAVQIVCQGAKAWHQLPEKEKNRYTAMVSERHRSALRCATPRSRSASQAKTHNNKHSCSVKTKGKFMKPGPVTRNGYLNFLREYRQTHCGLSAVEIVCQGAKAWHQLSEKEKNRYTAMVSAGHRSALRCATQRSRSASQAKTHNNNKHSCSVKTKGKFMKPGPVTRNGYLNFLREYRQTHCGLSAVEIVCQGAKAWHQLSEKEKNRYTELGCNISRTAASQAEAHSSVINDCSLTKTVKPCRPRYRSPRRSRLARREGIKMESAPRLVQLEKNDVRPGPLTRTSCQTDSGLPTEETEKNTLSVENKNKCGDKARDIANSTGKCMKPGPVTKNGYLNFLREYRQTQCGLSAVEVVCQGAKAWHLLPEAEKNRYTAMGCNISRSKGYRSRSTSRTAASQTETDSSLINKCSSTKTVAPSRPLCRTLCRSRLARRMRARKMRGSSNGRECIASSGQSDNNSVPPGPMMRDYQATDSGLPTMDTIMHEEPFHVLRNALSVEDKNKCGARARENEKNRYTPMGCKISLSHGCRSRPAARTVALRATADSSLINICSSTKSVTPSSKPRCSSLFRSKPAKSKNIKMSSTANGGRRWQLSSQHSDKHDVRPRSCSGQFASRVNTNNFQRDLRQRCLGLLMEESVIQELADKKKHKFQPRKVTRACSNLSEDKIYSFKSMYG